MNNEIKIKEYKYIFLTDLESELDNYDYICALSGAENGDNWTSAQSILEMIKENEDENGEGSSSVSDNDKEILKSLIDIDIYCGE